MIHGHGQASAPLPMPSFHVLWSHLAIYYDPPLGPYNESLCVKLYTPICIIRICIKRPDGRSKKIESYEFVIRNRMNSTIWWVKKTSEKKVVPLTPQVFGNSYNWVLKKKDMIWERDTYNFISVPEIWENHPKIRIVQFQSVYIWSTPYIWLKEVHT